MKGAGLTGSLPEQRMAMAVLLQLCALVPGGREDVRRFCQSRAHCRLGTVGRTSVPVPPMIQNLTG